MADSTGSSTHMSAIQIANGWAGGATTIVFLIPLLHLEAENESS